ncbi:hypothetical protein OH76DRAFT_1406290 [Lentinus brumalis]|uniref:Uncharacterized protein n=1 Tax=Lentinus brumalis TaxID=2498619 RepID=A0A371D3K2_9APHY|nr:hypothetical protein OH76DRAFT_1406290 [Polyporus brumalis]
MSPPAWIPISFKRAIFSCPLFVARQPAPMVRTSTSPGIHLPDAPSKSVDRRVRVLGGAHP